MSAELDGAQNNVDFVMERERKQSTGLTTATVLAQGMALIIQHLQKYEVRK